MKKSPDHSAGLQSGFKSNSEPWSPRLLNVENGSTSSPCHKDKERYTAAGDNDLPSMLLALSNQERVMRKGRRALGWCVVK